MPGLLPLPGDVVWIRRQRWRVERARRANDVVCLDVAGGGRRLTFLSPFDRPIAETGREHACHVRPQQAVARLAGLLASRRRLRTLSTAARARVVILPHQLEPAMALVGGARRVLVADEVGLGKTIEAGLAIAEFVERRGPSRVLIVVPSSLRRQWIDELRDRFDIACHVADAHAIDRHGLSGAPGDNPWRRSGVWVASLDYLKQPHVMEALPLVPWDLLVVDEAHTACGDSARHAALNDVARHARQILLLTATPHGGDPSRFSRLLSTGSVPGLDDAPIVFRRTRAGLGIRLDRRVRWHRVGLSDPESHVFDVLAAYDAAVLRAAGQDRRDAALLLLSVFRKRALSTMSALAASLTRRLRWLGDRDLEHDDHDDLLWLQPRLDFDDQDAISDEERASLGVDIGLDAGQERSWLRRLRLVADAAQGHDSKIARLVAIVHRAREPVAVFTEFRDSLEAVRRHLETVRVVSVLHGGQSRAEQQIALDRFQSGRASVLLATDVASLGLNLQARTRWVLSLELPWNPVRLEQRAGRVDRIGQTRSVHVTLLVGRHRGEDGVLRRLAQRTLAAKAALGPDVLESAVPDAALRACLIGGSPLDEAEFGGPPIDSCRRWIRPGRMAARDLMRLRALHPFWRTPATDRRPGRTALSRLPAMARASGGVLVVFSVAITAPDGEVVERAVVAVSVRGAGDVNAPLLAAARQRAASAMLVRVTRVRALRRGMVHALVAREQAIAAATIAARCPEEVQAGLFDQRAVRAASGARRDADEIRDACAQRVHELEQAVHVIAAPPVLELVFAPRQ